MKRRTLILWILITKTVDVVLPYATFISLGLKPLDKSTFPLNKEKELSNQCPYFRPSSESIFSRIRSPRLLASQADDYFGCDEDDQFFFIRYADFAEIGPAAKILTDGFFSRYKGNIFRYQLERIKTQLSLESTFQKNTAQNKHAMLVAGLKENGKVIGFAELDARRPVFAKPSLDNPDSGIDTLPMPYMCNLAVDEGWKRRGVASKLIMMCENICCRWGYDVLFLKVREENSAAIKLYESLGYSVNSVALENDPSDKEDQCYVMMLEKNLEPTKKALEKALN